MKGWLIVAALCFAACTRIDAPATPKPRSDAGASDALPCAIEQILRTKCQQCHGHPTHETAPMSLTTWQELHASAPEKKDKPAKVYERISERIHDPMTPMPPRDQPALSDGELSTLDIWLGSGAPGGKACTGGRPAADGGGTVPGKDASAELDTTRHDASGPRPAGTQGSAPKAGAAGEAPSAGSGAAGTSPANPRPAAGSSADAGQPNPTDEDQPVVPDDSECTYVDIVARNNLEGTPYQVPAGAQDTYRCFLFDQKFDVPTQALSFVPRNDNLGVMHHWVLYSQESFGSRDAIVPCDYPTGYKIIAGGAAGTDGWYLPKDVGVELGRGLFMLEVHYNNVGKPATTDQSGVRICTTTKTRPKTASISWLGVESFSIPPKSTDYTVANRCKPKKQDPIHILRYWPHMHNLGVRATLRVDHNDGTSETLHNAAYSFGSQKSYAVPYVLSPGDSLLATCYYNNPNNYTVSLGFNTTDEMCNHFVVAYPAYALTNDAPSAWNEACLGAP